MNPWNLIGWFIVGALAGAALAPLVYAATNILRGITDAFLRLYDYWPLKICKYIWNFIMKRGWTA